MTVFHKEYLYINGNPFRIIVGNHNFVLNFIKKYYLSYLNNGYRILLVDELNDKYYHYEYFDGKLKRIHCVCLSDFDRVHHSIYRDLF